MIAMKTCLAPLFLFLLFPHLQRIPAFNRGGMDWTRKKASKGEASELGVALDADGNMVVIYALSKARQEVLRRRMLKTNPGMKFHGVCDDLRGLECAREQSYTSSKASAEFRPAGKKKWLCNRPCNEACYEAVASREWHRNQYHSES
jgi:hypothetical protein